MELLINGETLQLPDNIKTVSDLLSHFRLSDNLVIVEVNLDFINKQNYKTARLSNGDKVEILQIVGGG